MADALALRREGYHDPRALEFVAPFYASVPTNLAVLACLKFAVYAWRSEACGLVSYDDERAKVVPRRSIMESSMTFGDGIPLTWRHWRALQDSNLRPPGS